MYGNTIPATVVTFFEILSFPLKSKKGKYWQLVKKTHTPEKIIFL
jgi:hypothetical protein